jgi:hypothetical protein
MFKVRQWMSNVNFEVTDENKNYMHSDGVVYHRCGEYWPTRKLAQAVLDKYQQPHVWEHGDVLILGGGTIATYHCLAFPHSVPAIFSLSGYKAFHGDTVPRALASAEFLFNIREKL